MQQGNPIVPMPEMFTVEENFGELTIEYKWSRLAGAIMLGFALIWCGMLFFIMSKMPGNMLPFTFIHAGIGIYLLYYGLCSLLNKTKIICTNQDLIVKIHPIPFFGNKKMNTSDITQLYFTKREVRNKNTTSIVYDLHVLTTFNKSIKLLKNLPDANAARFLEAKLEKFYKIKDAPVAGEYQ